MHRYTAEGPGDYAAACRLINALRGAGIDANITSGGVAMYLDNQGQTDVARRICKAHNFSVSAGLSSHQEQTLIDGGKMHLAEEAAKSEQQGEL